MILAAALVALTQCPDGSPPPCRAAQAVARPAAAPPPLSIAVLPFESRSPDSADAYLAEGMTEEVANRLTGLGRLQVKSRGLVRAQWRRTAEPLEAARGLGVSWFVHGNVRRVSGQLLVNVELVRAQSGEEAWAARFPRRDTDVFAVQAEVAESVAVIIGGRLSPREQASLSSRPTRNNEAYRLYLYGNAHIARRTEREARLAVDAYERAVALDPAFAAAWGRLATARSIQASWEWESRIGRDSLWGLALTSAARALHLDSTAADAWVARGMVEGERGELSASREAFRHAVRLDSTNAGAWQLFGATLYGAGCFQGCLDDYSRAEPLLRRALALDPTLRNAWRHLAAVTRDAGRLAEAEAQLDTALSFGPWEPAAGNRAYIRALRGNAAGARADLAMAADTGATLRAVVALAAGAALRAVVALAAGDSTLALDMLGQLNATANPGPGMLSAGAVLAAVLGRRDEALTLLERIRAMPDPQRAHCAPGVPCSVHILAWRLTRDAAFLPLHGEPRFQRIVNEARPRIPWEGP